jgi:beta-glucosidase/6-phospho-beta-glucosidase/beta-galactosidase
MYWAPRQVAKLWGVKSIYITENGASASDQPVADGNVYDLDRIMYLRNYLTQLQRATSEGVPVLGYFVGCEECFGARFRRSLAPRERGQLSATGHARSA